jgi:hypothetical protein
MGGCSYRSSILDLGIRWWAVSLIPLQPALPLGKMPRYPLDRRKGWPLSQSRDKFLAFAGIELYSLAVQPAVVAIQTEISRLNHRRVCRKENGQTIQAYSGIRSFDPAYHEENEYTHRVPTWFRTFDRSTTRTSIIHVSDCASTAIGAMFMLC